jgi:hypothetical protein
MIRAITLRRSHSRYPLALTGVRRRSPYCWGIRVF